ncbi:MAG TPA: PAS domain-containing protein [Acidobacteriaceae bacterium]|nr:PAS domain-containing protein [Acidobacteriaceae bacterium]
MLDSSDNKTSQSERETLLLRAQRAERQLSELLANIPAGYTTLDRNWKFTFANQQALLGSRQRPEDFMGKHIWTIWPQLLGTELERQLRQVMETGVPAHFEHYGATYDAWFEMHVYPIDDGISIYFQEITKRKRAEEALKASEQRYRAFTELNPQLILMADTNGMVTYANQRLLDYTGLTLEESLGEGWRSAVHPADEIRVYEAWMQALARDVDFEVETRIRRSDGTYCWFWVRGLPVRDEQNRTVYWLGVCIGIHELKLAMEELQKSQKEAEHQRLELETMYRTAPVGLALFDPVEFRYLRLNERQAEIVGLPMEEILGRTVTEIAPIEGLNEMFQQVANGTPIINHLLEGELPMQPGNYRYWRVNYSPVYGPDGTVRAITAASLEITAQQRAEKALIQSEKLAAVGRLASSISHEINNPLEAVTNLLFLSLNHEQLPETTRRYLQTAQGELSRVSHIATQSLRFHRQMMNPTHVHPKELVESVVDLYHGRLLNSNIEVVSKFKSTKRVWCFESDIRQVLNNLIANSVDAMRAGGRLILCSHDATEWKTGRSGVRITVADTGHGMSLAVQKRLFEPFYTTKEVHGTGLGLWISRGIVSRHQGSLTLRSNQKPGWNGSVFCLFLPDERIPSKPAQ